MKKSSLYFLTLKLLLIFIFGFGKSIILIFIDMNQICFDRHNFTASIEWHQKYEATELCTELWKNSKKKISTIFLQIFLMLDRNKYNGTKGSDWTKYFIWSVKSKGEWFIPIFENFIKHNSICSNRIIETILPFKKTNIAQKLYNIYTRSVKKFPPLCP
jgi:hypothetical protein